MPGSQKTTSRRRAAPSKGDLRELAILDAAERQLTDHGLEHMTVETIATAAGIARGALYFYFGSKNDVLTALVERTAASAVSEIELAEASAPTDPRQALRQALQHLAHQWHEHGAIMRMAVELSPTVTGIDQCWQSAITAAARATRQTMIRAGTPDNDSPTGAAAISRALVLMTERSFYEASKDEASLDVAAQTLTYVWLAALPD